ncbi:MAG: hypothetical protein ACI82A_000726 [Candidatus Azotimanducaceae bacterium]|jgi:hypothetical protein
MFQALLNNGGGLNTGYIPVGLYRAVLTVLVFKSAGLFLVLPPPVIKVPGIGTQAFIDLNLNLNACINPLERLLLP